MVQIIYPAVKKSEVMTFCNKIGNGCACVHVYMFVDVHACVHVHMGVTGGCLFIPGHSEPKQSHRNLY